MYNIRQRATNLKIKCELDNLTWNEVNAQLENNNDLVEKDDAIWINIDNEIDFDEKTYYKCINNICECLETNLKLQRDSLFHFTDKDHCPITNYSYIAIFFGPADNKNFFGDVYSHISKLVSFEICVKIKKTYDNITFLVCV